MTTTIAELAATYRTHAKALRRMIARGHNPGAVGSKPHTLAALDRHYDAMRGVVFSNVYHLRGWTYGQKAAFTNALSAEDSLLSKLAWKVAEMTQDELTETNAQLCAVRRIIRAAIKRV